MEQPWKAPLYFEPAQLLEDFIEKHGTPITLIRTLQAYVSWGVDLASINAWPIGREFLTGAIYFGVDIIGAGESFTIVPFYDQGPGKPLIALKEEVFNENRTKFYEASRS